MDGSKAGQPKQIVGLTPDGNGQLFDSLGMRQIVFFTPPNTNAVCGGALYTQPGEAFFSYNLFDFMSHWTPTTFDKEPSGVYTRFCALTQIPGIGIMASSNAGGIYVRSSSKAWNRIGDDDFYDKLIYAVTPFRDGFVIFGEDGYVAQYRPSTGFCMKSRSLAFSALTAVPFAGGLLAVGRVLDGVSNVVAAAILTPSN
jgi:hypothetical protein